MTLENKYDNSGRKTNWYVITSGPTPAKPQ
jgi:hypothetical protein